MHRFKRRLLIFTFLTIFILEIFFVQKTWANRSLAEQIADLKTQALVLQNQFLYMQNFSISKDLKLGDENEEVLVLQKFLNSDPETQIVSSGPGSLGQETNYFGQLTFLAVIKFQNKYATEVLHPAGLVFGNGYVGALTRQKINSLISDKEKNEEKKSVEDNQNIINNKQNIMDLGLGENLFSESDQLFLTFVSDYSGSVGDNLIIYGSGFKSSGNTLHFGDNYKVSNIKPSLGFLKVSVPNIPSGKYDLYFSNSEGVSNKSFFVVTEKNSLPPQIDSIVPSEAKYGDEVVVHGSNFTSSGNELRTSYGIIPDLESSDGKTLKFKVLPYPETPNLEKIYSKELGVSWDVQIYVVNSNGVDTDGATLTLDL